MTENLPRNQVLHGHVLDVLGGFPDGCVDVVVTSSPYWGLRDYGVGNVVVWGGKTECEHQWKDKEKFEHGGRIGTGIVGAMKNGSQTIRSYSNFCVKCGAWRGQLGLEPHPQMFIDHLIAVFAEVKRVLKPSGSCWVVLGDTYFGGKGQSGRKDHNLEERAMEGRTLQKREWTLSEQDCPQDLAKADGKWLQPKQKLLIPERFAIAMQENGWILRNTVVWHKINHMPSSVRDRLTNAYESVFFFVKSPRYYFDLDAIRKPHLTIKSEMKRKAWDKPVSYIEKEQIGVQRNGRSRNELFNPLGANPADVWSLTNEAFKGQHYATFPMKLVKRILLAAAPRQICNSCGKPRTKIIKKIGYTEGGSGRTCRKIADTNHVSPSSIFRTSARNVITSTVGYSNCGCNAGFHAALVLDPFCGSGTTLLTAHKLGLDWDGIDLNREYCLIAKKRILQHGKTRLDKFVYSEASP